MEQEQTRRVSYPKDLLVVDTETTGTDPNFHAVVELAAVRLDRHTLAETAYFSTLVRIPQGTRVDIRAMRVHKISQATIQATGVTEDEALGSFFATFGFDATLCGWNIGFDVGFLAAMAKHAALYDKFLDLDYHHLDLQSVAKYLAATGQIPAHKGQHALMKALRLDAGDAHRALDDCRSAATLLRYFANLAPTLGGNT